MNDSDKLQQNAAKAAILDSLRRQIVFAEQLPDSVAGPWIQYDDPIAQFITMVEAVGGSCTVLEQLSDLPNQLARLEPWREAKRIFSSVPEVAGNVDLQAVEDPHELNDLDFVIYRGELGVAENGAVWVTDNDLKHRVIFFITQYLALVVSRDRIVNNMHEAYSQIAVPQPGFGLFISGPSKTADIEQSLVIGAHGCRQLQVYLI